MNPETEQRARDLLGRPAHRVASAPGRVNLIGEHTDYNDGFAMPFAIQQRCVAAVAERDDGVVTVTSAQYEGSVTFDVTTQPGDVDGWAALAAGVVWSLREAGVDVPGADLAVSSEVWGGAGLSSSAAVESAIALALGAGEALAQQYGEDALAQLTLLLQRAENEYVGAPTGILDQSASLRATAEHLVLLDCRTREIELIPMDLGAAGLSLLVIDSMASHSHADGEYAARRASCEAAATALGVSALRDADMTMLDAAALPDELHRRARHIITENDRVLAVAALLQEGSDPRLTGPLLTASHTSMRDDFEITVPEVDVAVETALAAGVFGARMTGGGFGGCVIALIDTDRAEAVVSAVEAAFDRHGFTAPRHVLAAPMPGAAIHDPA
ncbi:galactokinase [Euzebya tangerina]|uniref:galactokinase n=1 Tax=Euzebya tangerina TaxID=591198 RepID=UPI000E310E6D|nr:galactokinase [Euzebya tangerina]